MGAAEQATLSYGLTQDTIVLVPLIILVVYMTLSLIRALIDNTKSGAKEKGIKSNSSTVDTQDNETQSKLFRPSAGIDQHAKEISGTVPVSTRRKDISLSASAEFTNNFSNNGNPATDESLHTRTISTISCRGEDTNVPETSDNRGHGQGRKGSYYSNNDIRKECRQVNTDCTFDPQTAKHIVVGITKSLIQKTQKQMFSAFKQSLQQSYASLSLETPVKAEEQSAKFINNDNIVILTSNTGESQTTDDWNEEEDDWNLDGVQPSLPSPSIQPAATSPDDMTPKVVAPTASGSNIRGAAATRSNASRSTNVSRPSAYISAIPAGYEDDDDYNNYYQPDNPRLITMLSTFAASINFRGRPNNRQVR